MKSREELLRELAGNPGALVDYALQLQEQLSQKDQLLAQKEQSLAEAQALIAELKQQLYGSRADKLTPEQEAQLQQLAGDLKDQAQRPPALSQEVLQEEVQKERASQQKRSKQRRRRHVPPVQLEKQTEVLEPEDKFCPLSGKERPRIGQEVSTEYDYQPAKLIIRETVRPK